MQPQQSPKDGQVSLSVKRRVFKSLLTFSVEAIHVKQLPDSWCRNIRHGSLHCSIRQPHSLPFASLIFFLSNKHHPSAAK
jgi:hypothetical protein